MTNLQTHPFPTFRPRRGWPRRARHPRPRRGGPPLGSVASTVARKPPCSVLLISPEAALAEGIAEAVTAQTAPAWHRELVPAT